MPVLLPLGKFGVIDAALQLSDERTDMHSNDIRLSCFAFRAKSNLSPLEPIALSKQIHRARKIPPELVV